MCVMVRCSCVHACVRACVRSCVRSCYPRSIQFALASFYAMHIHVSVLRKEEHACSINPHSAGVPYMGRFKNQTQPNVIIDIYF